MLDMTPWNLATVIVSKDFVFPKDNILLVIRNMETNVCHGYMLVGRSYVYSYLCDALQVIQDQYPQKYADLVTAAYFAVH